MFKERIIVIFLLVFSTSISYFLGNADLNILLLLFLSICPLIFIFFGNLGLYRFDLNLLLLMIVMISCSYLLNPESIRFSTIIYSFSLMISFMTYNRVLINFKLSLLKYQKIIRFILVSYFVVLISQQFCVLFNIPILNVAHYDLNNPWKLNSLAPEPSHTSVYMSVLMYCFIVTREIQLNGKYSISFIIKKDLMLWILFLWSIISIQSGTAFIYLLILMIKLIKDVNFYIGILIICIGYFSLSNTKFNSFDRITSFTQAVIQFDKEKIIETDQSASYRIIPSMVAFEKIDLNKYEGWLGYGIDHMKNDLPNQIKGTSENAQIGSLFTFAVDYGILCFIIFISFAIRATCDKKDLFSVSFFVLAVLLNSINSQLLWFSIIFLFTNKYIRSNNVRY